MSTSIAAILQGNNPNNIDLQVVRIHSPSASRNPDYYKSDHDLIHRLTLSDGQHTIIGVLHQSLSHLVKSSEIKEGSIIRLGNWTVSTVETLNKRVLLLNSNVAVIGHERIKNSKLLVECPDVNKTETLDDIEDSTSIGPVYEGPEIMPPPAERPLQEDWLDFTNNGLEYVKVVNDNCYLYIEAGNEPLVDVHAQLPARKVDVYAAVVVKMAQQSVGYCRGYTCSFGNTEGTVVAIVLLRSKRVLNLAVLTTTGNIVFRTPTPGEITRKQYKVTTAMSLAWKNHLEAATASVVAAKEKRATKTKPSRKTPLSAPVKSVESSESSESEVPLKRSSKRKREVTVNPPAKRQRTEKQLFQLDDHLEDLDAPLQSVAYAAKEDLVILQQQLTRVNQQLSSQQNQIVELHDNVNNKLSKIKELTAQLAALSEDLETTKTTLAKLSTKGSVLTPVPAEPTFQSPEKIVYLPAPRPVETRYVPVPDYYPPDPHLSRTPSRYYPYH